MNIHVPEAGFRRRSSLLDAMELFRALHREVSITDVLMFLAVAESPGIGISALACRLGVTPVTASRSLRSFAPQNFPEALPPALGLVEIRTSPQDNRSRQASLTPAGRELAVQLSQIVSGGALLLTEGRPPSSGCVSPRRSTEAV